MNTNMVIIIQIRLIFFGLLQNYQRQMQKEGKSMKRITQLEAIEQGLTRFYTGRRVSMAMIASDTLSAASVLRAITSARAGRLR